MVETFLEKPASLELLSQKSKDKLTQVPDYPLDYNIFLCKGIAEAQKDDEAELLKFRESIVDSIPDDYGNLIFKGLTKNGDGSMKLESTTTSKLQRRLLLLLILERHRRDIIALNRLLATDPKNCKIIHYVELKDPMQYEIKSPIFRSFEGAKDVYQGSFKKISVLQNIEYDFEHAIDENGDYQNDDDLVDAFCTEDVMKFNSKLNETDDKAYDSLEDVVANSRIARVLIPLAAQAFLLDDGKEEKKNGKRTYSEAK